MHVVMVCDRAFYMHSEFINQIYKTVQCWEIGKDIVLILHYFTGHAEMKRLNGF